MAELPEIFVRYLAARDAQRDEHVSRALSALTDRERALVREAAVMGYVHGTMDGRAGVEFPKDSTLAALPERTSDGR